MVPRRFTGLWFCSSSGQKTILLRDGSRRRPRGCCWSAASAVTACPLAWSCDHQLGGHKNTALDRALSVDGIAHLDVRQCDALSGIGRGIGRWCALGSSVHGAKAHYHPSSALEGGGFIEADGLGDFVGTLDGHLGVVYVYGGDLANDVGLAEIVLKGLERGRVSGHDHGSVQRFVGSVKVSHSHDAVA